MTEELNWSVELFEASSEFVSVLHTGELQHVYQQRYLLFVAHLFENRAEKRAAFLGATGRVSQTHDIGSLIAG